MKYFTEMQWFQTRVMCLWATGMIIRVLTRSKLADRLAFTSEVRLTTNINSGNLRVCSATKSGGRFHKFILLNKWFMPLCKLLY